LNIQNTYNTLEIRRAKTEDIELLSFIHREGFPELLGYQVPLYYLKKWWAFLIIFNAVEVYVASLNGNTIGAATLLIKAKEYFKEKKRLKAPLWVRIFSILSNPKLLSIYFRKILHTSDITPHNNSHFNSVNHIDNTTWIDPIVISPLYRGKGFAKKLLIFLEERTLSIHRDTIALIVDSQNKSAISLYKSLGYIQYDKAPDGYLFYKKCLNS